LCLQFLSFDDLGEVIATLGFDGVELIVAKGRHVLPENVKIDLPKAVKAMRKAGIDVPMIVTEINDADHQLTEDILGTAADQGIKYFKELGPILYSVPITIHYEYDLGGSEMGNTNPSMPPRKIYKHLVRDLHFFRHEIYGN
jgi:sugar phosphate isomerase/epimerase